MLDDIRVFDSNDKNLKLLGELLSNETSRNIIKLLIDKEMYTNEIATTLDLRVSLVIHHLKKLEQIGLIEVNEKQIIKKGVNHRYFKAVPMMFISMDKTKEEIKEKGILKKIFKDGLKITGAIFTGILATLFFTKEKITDTKIPSITITNEISIDPEIESIVQPEFPWQDFWFAPFLIMFGVLGLLLYYRKK